MLLVTHEIGLAARLASSVLLLRAGRTIAGGPRSEVLTADNLGRVFGAPFEARGSGFAIASGVLPGGLPDL